MSSVFLDAFSTALRPIIKLMLRNGVDVAQFTSLARAVYVSVAQDEEFALRGTSGKPRKITHSRISMLTGINRKEVRQLIENDDVAPRHTTANRAVRVLTGWVEDKRFQDRSGEPMPLTYGVNTKQASFEELVQKYSADTTVRVVLDELIHVGSVRLDDDGYVYLIEKGYVPISSHEEMIGVGSRALADLANTVAYNIHRPDDSPVRLQMTVRYDDVPIEGAGYYRPMLKNDAEEFISQQNKNLSLFDRSITPEVEGTGRCIVGVGIYYIEELISD